MSGMEAAKRSAIEAIAEGLAYMIDDADLFDLILGAGADTYPHYWHIDIDWQAMTFQLLMDDPNPELEPHEPSVKWYARKDADDLRHAYIEALKVSPSLREVVLRSAPEVPDLDAADADVVLQISSYGEVVWG